jgi:diguanylate cyclase (GGDEF)-like protein/PAS domain S-box-containing protein
VSRADYLGDGTACGLKYPAADDDISDRASLPPSTAEFLRSCTVDRLPPNRDRHVLNRTNVAEGDFLRALVESAGDAVMVIESRGTMLYASTGLSRFAGVAVNDLVGRPAAMLFHPDDQRPLVNEVTRMVQTKVRRATWDCRLVSATGEVFTVELELVNERGNPAIDAFVLVVRDVGALRAAEAKAQSAVIGRSILARVSARFANSNVEETERDIHETLDDLCVHARMLRAMLWIPDEFNRFLVANDEGGCDDTLDGHAPDVPLTMLRTVAPQFFDGEPIDARLGSPTDEIVRLVSTGDEEPAKRVVLIPLRLAGTLVGMLTLTPPEADRDYGNDGAEIIASIANVLANALGRRNAERALAHQALHDPLTGLPNRSLLLDRLELALARSLRTGENVTVLLIDLDGFKDVNDTLGHAAGDDLLRTVARRLQHTLRDADSVARLGGDEFVVVAETSQDALHAGTVASRILEALREPIRVANQQVTVSGSIGVMVGNASDDKSIDAATLLRKADIAMYRAKSGGRDRIEVFSDEMEDKILKRFALLEDLQRAVKAGDVVAWFQPIIDVASGRLTSFEALARWIHAERGVIPPADFIELAEGTGVVHALGRAILEQSVAQLAAWHREGLVDPSVTISVNVSVRQLLAHDFVDGVAEILTTHGLAPANLHLELTESILADRKMATGPLLRLRDIGVRVSIDDFGTGYSSLSYLRDLPIDCLKIDRSFVQGLGSDRRDSALVGAVVTMALELGLDVVAEGVETQEQFSQLERLGCQQAQGFLFGRPGPAAGVAAAIAQIASSAASPVGLPG